MDRAVSMDRAEPRQTRGPVHCRTIPHHQRGTCHCRGMGAHSIKRQSPAPAPPGEAWWLGLRERDIYDLDLRDEVLQAEDDRSRWRERATAVLAAVPVAVVVTLLDVANGGSVLAATLLGLACSACLIVAYLLHTEANR